MSKVEWAGVKDTETSQNTFVSDTAWVFNLHEYQMGDKDNTKTNFFTTPIGMFITAILVVLVLALIVGIFTRGKKVARNNTNMNNNAYFRRGQVPPSLAGYI